MVLRAAPAVPTEQQQQPAAPIAAELEMVAQLPAAPIEQQEPAPAPTAPAPAAPEPPAPEPVAPPPALNHPPVSALMPSLALQLGLLQLLLTEVCVPPLVHSSWPDWTPCCRT
jgi:hypothetical protein